MKKTLFYLFSVIGLGLSSQVIYAQNNQIGAERWLGINGEIVGGVGVAGAKEANNETQANDDLIGVIKKFINWILSILSLIALILLLWGGFQMVTASGDETKYSAGFKIFKNVAIGLAFIAVSRFIVSIIFRIIRGSGAWVSQ